jgi:precorrin-6Y C5,15-methyltransferase (decarboxylating), cbiT subunit
MLPGIVPLFESLEGMRVVVLGSGDPMFHGIGTTLCRLLGPERIRIIPVASSASLTCARLGWAVDRTPVVSLVSNPVSSIIPLVDQGEPFLVLGRDETTPTEVCTLLRNLGHAAATVHVLSDIGSSDEQHNRFTATDDPQPISALNVIAIQPDGPTRSIVPGLSDDSYDTDGQLTKQHIRALTICSLAPRPGEVLWDIGGGSGSIAIEWLRSSPRTRAWCAESDEVRATRITANANALGVPHLRVVGAAPESLIDAPAPDAVFIGGGLTAEGVFDAAWAGLKPGGRLVANAVTIESEQMLWQLRQRFGGHISRFDISTEHAIGGFTALKAALPVTQWRVVKEGSNE